MTCNILHFQPYTLSGIQCSTKETVPSGNPPEQISGRCRATCSGERLENPKSLLGVLALFPASGMGYLNLAHAFPPLITNRQLFFRNQLHVMLTVSWLII